MGWVYLDDHFPEHPKVLAAGDAAAWLYVCGLAYANRRLMGGKIPRSAIPRLTGARNGPALAKKLVDVELWEDVGDHYQIHDYDQWNESALKRSEKARAAADIRWRKPPRADAQAMPEHPPSNANGTARAMPEQSSTDADAVHEQCLLPSPQSPVVQNQDPALGVTHDGGGSSRAKRDPESEKPGTTPAVPVDPLLAQLEAVCTGKNRATVRFEAVQVLGWARTHFDRKVIEETLGYAAGLDQAPVLPRAVAGLLQRKADDYELTVPPFQPVGKAVGA